MMTMFRIAAITLLFVLLAAIPASAADGYYYNDPSGAGSWFVPDGQTPPQALYNLTLSAHVCVDARIVYSLRKSFPTDPYVILIFYVSDEAICTPQG